MNENLNSLVYRVKKGGSDADIAFADILKILTPELKKIASKYYISGGDSEDVLQEARIGVWKAIESWSADGGMNFKNFALNLCCKRHIITVMSTANRKKYAILNQSVSYDMPINTGDEGEQTLADFIEDPNSKLLENFIKQEEYKDNHQKIMSKLTDLEKHIYLYYLQDYSYREIANGLHIKTKAVDNALMRIRKKASEIYSKYVEENN